MYELILNTCDFNILYIYKIYRNQITFFEVIIILHTKIIKH